MRPTRDVVIVNFKKQETTTESGIIVQGSSQDTRVGTVQGIGPQCESVRVYDEVIADWTKGNDIGKGMLAIKEQHIQGVIERD
jgi:co-chaperonin GroES (HSP10)